MKALRLFKLVKKIYPADHEQKILEILQGQNEYNGVKMFEGADLQKLKL